MEVSEVFHLDRSQQRFGEQEKKKKDGGKFCPNLHRQASTSWLTGPRINSKSSDRTGHEGNAGLGCESCKSHCKKQSKEATKRAFLKCTGRPAADTIEVGGKMVVLRAQAEKEKDVDQQQEGFFAGLKKEEAARAVLKEKEPTQIMKDFAFRSLSVEKQGPVWNSPQEDDEEMEEENEAGSASFKEHKETPLQIALSKSLEQKLKTKRARHAEEMRETRQRLEDAQREILERRNMEAESQIQVVQTQAIKSVEDVNMIMGRQLLEEMMNKQKETIEQMKAWFVQTQQECLQQLAAARDEKLRKTTASVTP